MPSARHALFATTIALLGPGTARAQVDLSVDAGAARLLQFNLPQSDVLTLGGQLRWQGTRALLTSSAISAHTPDGSWTAQGIITGSLFAPPFRRSRWEIGASLSSFGATNSLPTVNAMAGIRQHIATSRTGAFIGVQGGGIVLDDVWRHAVIAQSGGWLRRRGDVLSLSLALTDSRSALWISLPEFQTAYQETNPATYTDATAFWQHEGRSFEVSAGGGLRTNVRGAVRDAVWGAVSASVWLTPRVALVASSGRALEDVVRGVPTARYHTIAFRFGMRDRVRAYTPRPKLPADAVLLTVQRRRDGPHVITVRVARATSVEIMASFTDWEPRSLVANGDRWQGEYDLTPGAHRVAIRVDGGEWKVPANLPSVADDFGGTVGLLSVP